MGWRIFRLLIIANMVTFSIGCKKSDTDWTVVFPVIPEAITIADANINIVQYILKQTHEPIFREKEQGVFESRILEKWERTSDNRKFLFCIDTNVYFDKDLPLQVGDIQNSIQGFLSKSDTIGHYSLTENCLKVSLDKPQPTIFRFLSGYRYAPSRKINSRYELGLGAYRVKMTTGDQIVLDRKPIFKNNSGFQSITILSPELVKDDGSVIEDINRSIDKIPDWVHKKKYNSYSVSLLQTLVVVLNIPELHIRHEIMSCMESAELRNAFNPEVDEFIEVSTILPLEIYPLKSRPEQVCKYKIKSSNEIHFINWRTNNYDSLATYLSSLSLSSGKNIVERRMNPSEFVDKLVKKPKDYDQFHIIPFALDAGDADLTPFFRMFFDSEKRHIVYRLPEGEALYAKLQQTSDPVEGLKIARDLADLLDREAVVIPMYQVRKKFYYPSHVKNLKTGRNFLEYPEVAELEF